MSRRRATTDPGGVNILRPHPSARGAVTRRRRTSPATAIIAVFFCAAVAAAGAILCVPAAVAQTTVSFTNGGSPVLVGDASDDGSGGPRPGLGNPYPSHITVSGLTAGTVTGLTVRLNGLYHSSLSDLNFLFVAPGGGAVRLLFGGGDPVNGTNVPQSAALNLAFRDDAAVLFPTGSGVSVTSGTYRPTFAPERAAERLPGVTGPYGDSLLDTVSGGADPNGAWRLHITDTVTGDAGGLAGGWSLQFVTGTSAAIPEPGALSLVGAGASAAAAAVVIARRRRRAAGR